MYDMCFFGCLLGQNIKIPVLELIIVYIKYVCCCIEKLSHAFLCFPSCKTESTKDGPASFTYNDKAKIRIQEYKNKNLMQI